MTELVSISMLAYNHAPWIEQAIMSIVNQKTEYPFRLYVHDDASTDGTAEIIQRLAEKYPDKITAILQKENQYSKGVNITQGIIRPKMKGEYIALCEGDDYWVDEYKLQKQVSYMESHPDCSLCFSDAMVVDTDGNRIRNFFDNRSWNDKKINAKLKQKGGADFSVEAIFAFSRFACSACYGKHGLRAFSQRSVFGLQNRKRKLCVRQYSKDLRKAQEILL